MSYACPGTILLYLSEYYHSGYAPAIVSTAKVCKVLILDISFDSFEKVNNDLVDAEFDTSKLVLYCSTKMSVAHLGCVFPTTSHLVSKVGQSVPLAHSYPPPIPPSSLPVQIFDLLSVRTTQ